LKQRPLKQRPSKPPPSRWLCSMPRASNQSLATRWVAAPSAAVSPAPAAPHHRRGILTRAEPFGSIAAPFCRARHHPGRYHPER
jgi:hypothetical protein